METALRLKDALQRTRPEWLVPMYAKSRNLEHSITESVSEWAGARFKDSDALVFVGACGIAVRSIAPWIRDKKTDPAVVVLDECARYSIALLSGHLGGANELSGLIAKATGAQNIVTTATDLQGRFAVDVFARNNGCYIEDMNAARAVSAAVLDGSPVGFYSDLAFDGELPEELTLCTEDGREVSGNRTLQTGICVTYRTGLKPFECTCFLVPGVLVLGMGCRRNASCSQVLEGAAKCLEGFRQEAVCCLSSIDLKAKEEALISLADAWHIPFETWSAAELMAAQGDFACSGFVLEKTGADNVCERSASVSARGGALIRKKTASGPVTAAIALMDRRISFEK